MLLKFFGTFGGLAYAYQQHPRSQRVKGACMPHLEILLVEMPARAELDLADDIRGSPPVRLVHRKNNPLRIIIDVSGEDYVLNIFLVYCQCHYLHGIFSILLSCLPPSNGVSSHTLVIA